MKDFNTVEKKLELIFAKYELINYSTKRFKESYCDEKLYYELLSRLETILIHDSDFILLGDNMDKYRDIINLGRFQYKTNSEIRDCENLILTTLNDQELTKKENTKKYLVDQLKIRLSLNKSKIDTLLYETGEKEMETYILEFSEFDYTYLNFMNIINKGLKITTKEAPIKYVSTIHYLLSNAIEIFWQDPRNIDTTLGIIHTLEEKSLLPSSYGMKKVKKTLNRMSKKR